MRPEKGRDTVQIPLTFDKISKMRITTEGKKIWFFILILIWVFTSILFVIGGKGSITSLLYPPSSLMLFVLIYRYVIMKEPYFRSKREELRERNYQYDYGVFWGIYEISEKYPYVVQFADGRKGIYVALDKDVIIGKEVNDDYYHHEAIGDAYQQMIKRGIECVHIDYMDRVGKDDRLEGLFESISKTENEDLRKVLTRVYDNIEYNMNRSYACYDVYCFYFKGREDIFWDELQVVLNKFLEANYVRHRVLNREDIKDLAESVMNINHFSVSVATEGVFKEMNSTQSFLKVIWVEKEGVREIRELTEEEVKEKRRVYEEEKRLSKWKKRRDKGKKKEKSREKMRKILDRKYKEKEEEEEEIEF